MQILGQPEAVGLFAVECTYSAAGLSFHILPPALLFRIADNKEYSKIRHNNGGIGTT